MKHKRLLVDPTIPNGCNYVYDCQVEYEMICQQNTHTHTHVVNLNNDHHHHIHSFYTSFPLIPSIDLEMVTLIIAESKWFQDSFAAPPPPHPKKKKKNNILFSRQVWVTHLSIAHTC